ncbi:SDR family oxidoreductase [Henriciella mobilis]|uniref:SDR family oxidoreductase n=1 Tax=Henriciella mobilis TaxID=2305467 RepID=A0A399RJS1_9PROT|nr:SDR family oxidoreductase [Henriciella mobilis]RIJ29979.1 SDR family oxidoreductase [Henriciella mobilis]
MTDQSPTLFLVGPGYSASRLAALCLDTGAWRVVGTARSEDKAAALREKGIEPVLTNDRDGLSQAAKASHWVISTPPGDEGCPGFGLVGDFAREAASVTYLSTTGVYGDLDGGWAFEWSPVNPGTKRGERRVLAEQQWLSVRRDTRLVRLPGIYGPGRSQLDRVREGKEEQIVKPGQVFSRIHVDDLANGLFALLQHPGLSGAFNLCDEEAAPPQDVMAYAADLLGMAMPVPVDLETADVSAMARSFYSECKRVSNARLKAATGWRPHYPTYREGLSAIFKAENN